MTDLKLKECLGRLSSLRWFPANPYAIAAVGETLRELCPSDEDAAELVREVLANFAEWPAPLALRETRKGILDRKRSEEIARKLKLATAEWHKARAAHEAGCDGFEVQASISDRTVYAQPCSVHFGGPEGQMWQWLCCRKGSDLSAEDIQRRLDAELAARPGWISLKEFYKRGAANGTL